MAARAVLDPPKGTGAAALVPTLLCWYDAHARVLPWRGARDPYAVWVSEVMLQQTRVETVIPYYERWMAGFPTITALADATEDDVLGLWSGLGYYSRARNLHRGARVVASDLGGVLPATVAELRRIPGIGEYTAGAIASIAFGARTPAVDGNVLRVLARLDNDGRDILAPATRRAMTTTAATLVPAHRPGDWNQALMDLGATVCTPANPRCDACPVRAFCRAYAAGSVAGVPVRKRRAPPEQEARHFAYVVIHDQVLVTRNPDGLLGGLWSLPGADTVAGLEEVLAAVVPGARVGGILGEADHRFTHRRWRMVVHAAHMPSNPATAPETDDVRWVSLAALDTLALSTAQRKCLAVASSTAKDPEPPPQVHKKGTAARPRTGGKGPDAG